jgi:hypothetical protein
MVLKVLGGGLPILEFREEKPNFAKVERGNTDFSLGHLICLLLVMRSLSRQVQKEWFYFLHA